MTSIHIRSSHAKDDEAIVALQIKGWQTAYKGIIDDDYLSSISSERRLQGRRERFEKKNTYSIIAIIDDKIVGMLDFGVSRYPQHGAGEIFALYVDPDYQNKNIGRALMEEAQIRLKNKNLLPVVLLTLKDNKPARKFYEKCGYHIVDELDVEINNRMYRDVIYSNRLSI